jgi:hypothetical protein
MRIWVGWNFRKGQAPIFGLFGSVSVALSCCWFSKLSNGLLAAKSNVMSRVRQPPSKDKLVAAAELTNFRQRKADLRNAMSYLAIMPNPFLEVFPKRVRRAPEVRRPSPCPFLSNGQSSVLSQIKFSKFRNPTHARLLRIAA